MLFQLLISLHDFVSLFFLSAICVLAYPGLDLASVTPIESLESLVLRNAPAVESLAAGAASPWTGAGIFQRGNASISPGAGSDAGIWSLVPGDISTGTHSCVVFPPSSWNPQQGFQPCANDIAYPACSLVVPPYSAGGDPDLPWITCTDGYHDSNGSWAMQTILSKFTATQNQFSPAVNSLPYTNMSVFADMGPHSSWTYPVQCECLNRGSSHLGDDVCGYVACPDWTPWDQGPRDAGWPFQNVILAYENPPNYSAASEHCQDQACPGNQARALH